MHLANDEEKIHLIDPPTRVVNRNEVHELIATDDANAAPGATVNNVLYLGFFEVTTGGVIVGEDISVGNRSIGKIGGFNDIHSPNHINIIVKVKSQFADEVAMREGDRVIHDLPLNLGENVRIGRQQRI